MARSVSVRRLVIAALVLIFPSVALAQTIYVNNVRGRDQCDGSLEVPTDVRTGPVRTLHRALKLAGPSDTIQITNTGRPYDSDIRLFGTRHSGLPGLPFRIVGNGAVITGRRPIPPLAWRRLDALWTLAPRRKGYYLFLRDGKLLPRHPLTGTIDSRGSLVGLAGSHLLPSRHGRSSGSPEPGDCRWRLWTHAARRSPRCDRESRFPALASRWDQCPQSLPQRFAKERHLSRKWSLGTDRLGHLASPRRGHPAHRQRTPLVATGRTGGCRPP